MLIDPDELPFTEEEIARAGATFLPADEAASMAAHLADCASGLTELREARRAEWHRAGLLNARTLPLHGWVYPEELLPALARLSPEVAARVQQLQAFLAQRHRAGEP